MEMKSGSPVTVNAEQATTYAVEENVNLGLIEPQGSVTRVSNCNAQYNNFLRQCLRKGCIYR